MLCPQYFHPESLTVARCSSLTKSVILVCLCTGITVLFLRSINYFPIHFWKTKISDASKSGDGFSLPFSSMCPLITALFIAIGILVSRNRL